MKTFTFSLLFSLLTFASAQAQGYIFAATDQPDFRFETYNLGAADTAQSRLQAFVSIIYDDLEFAPVSGGYEANYVIALTVSNKDGQALTRDELTERVHLNSLAETNSKRTYNFHDFAFDLPPGEYQVTCVVTDQVSKSSSQKIHSKKLRDFTAAAGPLEISEAFLAEQAVQSGERSLMIRPGLYENTTAPNREAFIYFEIYNHVPQVPVVLRQTILNRQKEKLLDQQREWPRQGGKQYVVLPIWTDTLPYGSYEIVMEVQSAGIQKTVSTNLRVSWDGIPSTGIHLGQALRVAQSVATGEEKLALEKALISAIAEQRQALSTFWGKRDKSPDTAENEAMTEFYRRFEIANEKFSGSKEGWQTDRGQTFLKYGAPDEIELYSRAAAAQPYQLWHYRKLNWTFKFVDEEGLGEFELASHGQK